MVVSLLRGLIVLVELESDLVALLLADAVLDSSVVVGVEVDVIVTGGGIVEAGVVVVDRPLPLPLVTDEDTEPVLLLREEPVASEVLEVVADVVLLLWLIDDSPGGSLVVSVEVVPDVLPRLVPGDVAVSAGDVLVDPLEREDDDDDEV